VKRKRAPFAVSPMDRERDMYARQRRACADLVLAQCEEGDQFGRYLLKPGGRWLNYTWIEVVTLRNGVLVHGDCKTCFFSGYGAPNNPRGPIYWQARKDSYYGAQKAGFGGTKTSQWCQETAAYYVLDWRRQKSIDKESARDLYDGLRSGWDEHEFVAECYRHSVESESIGSACDSVSWNVVIGQCVLMHLVELLERRDFQHQARDWFTREAA